MVCASICFTVDIAMVNKVRMHLKDRLSLIIETFSARYWGFVEHLCATILVQIRYNSLTHIWEPSGP